ncbi:MAG: peptidylprolyl isomerase [Candidatus Hydrogenedentes bacterium]|nr:peptidylprolyl isomerase [Candidatus Hydrogenedentota bacterium]
MKIVCFFALFLIVSSVFGQVPDLSKMDIVEKSVPDGPVAIVLGVPVSKEEFLTRYKTELLECIVMSRNKNPSDIDRVRVAIRCLTLLAEREILYQEGLKRKYTATDGEVKKEMDEQVTILKEVLKSEGKKEPTFEDVLKLRGDTPESFKERTRKNVILEKVKKAIAEEKKISVSDSEIKQFYEQNPQLFLKPTRIHLQHIFKQPKPNAKMADEKAWSDTLKEVEKALARIRAGESFEAVARSVSDASDRDKGGDMGWMPVSGLPPFYAEAVVKLQKGEVSVPIKSNLGWHLIKVVDKESEEKISLEEARDEIHRVIYERKLDEVLYEFCRPYLNDPEKVKFFLALDPVLKKLVAVEGEKLSEQNSKKDSAVSGSKSSTPQTKGKSSKSSSSSNKKK